MSSPFRLSRAALLLSLAAGLVRADSTTEAEQAAITNGTLECVPYGLALVSNAIAANQIPLPVPLDPVTNVRNDSVGFAKFQAINGSIPNIAVKNANITYDQATDADCYWSLTQCVTPKHPGVNADVAIAPEPNTLGYGFDDGPACDHNVFYNYLSSVKQLATMYYIGKNVAWYPLEAQRAAVDGHHICVHTWSHPLMTYLDNESAFAELWYTIKVIKLVTGVTPTCWRPPHGDVDDRIRFIAQSLGLETIMWKYDSFDWENGLNNVTPTTVQNNYNNIIAAAKNGTFSKSGAILLTHELNNFTMQTAIDNYPALIDAFDYVVPLAVALNQTTPYAETNITFPSFADYAKAHPKGSSPASNSTSTTGGTGTGTGTTGKTTGEGAAAGMSVNLHLGLGLITLVLATFACS